MWFPTPLPRNVVRTNNHNMCEFDANMSTTSIAIDSVIDCIGVSGCCGKVASGEVVPVVEGVLGTLVGPVVGVGPEVLAHPLAFPAGIAIFRSNHTMNQSY